MKPANNIYDYKPGRRLNEETHYLYINGRITVKAFLLRFAMSVMIYLSVLSVYWYYAVPKKILKTKIVDGCEVIYDLQFKTTFYYFEQFVFIYLPLILIFVLLIQAIKRIHDVDKSGWFVAIPFYNLFLLLSSGKEGNNDYGIDPKPKKKIEYFDQLDKKKIS